MRRVLVAVVAALLTVPAAFTAEASTDLAIGGPVTWLGTIGEPGMVSGRVVDGTDVLGRPTRFLVTHGPRGISVYDIAVPERPSLAGHLPLPHFYTEDMDLGGDVLIVALDPSWGDIVTSPGTIGGLYIVDISQLPQLSLHYVDPLTGNLWKEPAQATGGGGHTISCIRADCTWAYVNGSSTIGVLDLRDPAQPQVATTFASPVGSTHDIQVDEAGYAWMVGSRGVVAYDTTNPTAPVRVTNASRGDLGYHHNSLRPDAGDTLLLTEEAVWPGLEHNACGDSSFGGGQGRFQTRRITGGDGVVGTGGAESLQVLDTWETELQLGGVAGKAAFWCSAHYFGESDSLVSIAWYEQGTRFLDVSDPTDIRQVGYFVPVDGEAWDAQFIGPSTLGPEGGEIVYTFDFVRGIDILRIDRHQPLLPVQAPVLSHWLRPAAEAAADLRSASGVVADEGTFMCRLPAATR